MLCLRIEATPIEKSETSDIVLKKDTSMWSEVAVDIQNKVINPLSTNRTKWSSTLKQFGGKKLTNCLSVFDHFVGLALKGLIKLTGSF